MIFVVVSSVYKIMSRARCIVERAVRGIIAFIALTAVAGAQSGPPADQQDMKQQLENIEKKLGDKTAAIEDLAEKEKKAHAKARALREEMEITAKVKARLDQTSQQLGRQYTAAERRVRQLQERQLFRQEVLARTLRNLYTSRPIPGTGERIGVGSSFGHRQLYAQKISAAQAGQIENCTDSLTAEDRQRIELADTRHQVQAAAAKKDKEREQTQRLLAKSDREAFSYRQQRTQELDEIEDIQREALILGELIDRLAELPGVREALDYDFPGWKGRLQWPLTGEVKSTVGWKVDGKYQTETYETGMFIAGPAGSAVVNAADGEVAYAGRRRGLGNVVVVGHGMEYFSVFAHLGEMSVIVGQVLRAGDRVGTAGESHPRFGAGVLFELRHKKEVLDPLEWLP